MYFAVNIHLSDAIYTLQGLQQIVVIAALLTVGYLLFRKKNFTKAIKLWLWCLAAAWTIASVGLYTYALHTYVHDYRPLYEKENLQQKGLKY